MCVGSVCRGKATIFFSPINLNGKEREGNNISGEKIFNLPWM